jgi:hypothetical protein
VVQASICKQAVGVDRKKGGPDVLAGLTMLAKIRARAGADKLVLTQFHFDPVCHCAAYFADNRIASRRYRKADTVIYKV